MSWVPQLFYDLIGRVVPGAAVLVSSFLLLQDLDAAEHQVFLLFAGSGIPLSVLLLIGLLLSYLIGALLGAIGFFVQGKEWRTKPPELSISKPPDLRQREPLRAFIYDAIQLYDPQAGARLAKLSAEQHMCRVLIVGFILLYSVRIIQSMAGSGSGYFWAATSLSIAVVLGSWMFHRHLGIRSMRLLANHWHSLDLARRTRLSDAGQGEGAPDTAVAADPKAPLPVAEQVA